MLTTLRRIVQEVNAAHDLGTALQIMVRRVKEAAATNACSIFLTDEESGEYVFVATEGLNPYLLNRVRLNMGEGLIGLVGEREEPISVEDAPAHPRYLLYPGIGEEKYHAFLGVPLMHQRQLLGILVVQQLDKRRFDESEEAFLVTLGIQLAGIIAHARATGTLTAMTRRISPDTQDISYVGVSGASGVSMGTAVVVYPAADLDAVPDREIEDVATDIRRFEEALKSARDHIKNVEENLAAHLPSAERGLFDAYLRILDSASLIEEIKSEIRGGQWVQGALKRVIKRHVLQFEAMEDPYLRERASDLMDLAKRILFYLQEGEKRISYYPKHTILVGEEVTPADLAEVPEDRLVGVASIRGSANSHVAILARAMGIPTVMGINGLAVGDVDGSHIILDGYYGQIYVNPSHAVKNEFSALLVEEEELKAELEELRDVSAETIDGYRVSLHVNTGLVADIGRAMKVAAEGVGLYRTEIPFMIRDRFPTEEEQRVIYHQLLAAFAPRAVTMRTLDIGADKTLPYFPIVETNPCLGWRGIRVTLDQPEIFLVQVRAMMRASIGLDNMRIMLPMISGVNEVEEASRLITQAYNELIDDGHNVTFPKLGIMVEIPSAVYQAPELAERVDFVSVGSNDLIQYLLAVDRTNARVGALYDSLHPAVLRALKFTVDSCKQHGKPISICGEMAAEPAAVVLLLAMGFDILSMNASALPRVKWIVRKLTMKRAKKLLDEVMQMDDPTEIRCHVELVLEEHGLGGLIRAGK